MTVDYAKFGYRGRLPSQASAQGVPMSDAEMLGFELAARKVAIARMADTTAEARGEAAECRFHGHDHEPDDPKWRTSDEAWARLERIDPESIPSVAHLR